MAESGSPLSARFFVCVERAWPWSTGLEVLHEDDSFLYLAGGSALAASAELFDYYLDKQRFSCCDLQVGFAVTVDGRPWNDFTPDHFWHQTGWLFGLRTLLEGGPASAVNTFVWDESFLQLKRGDDRLTMLDGHPEHGRIHAPEVTVDFRSFAREILREARLCAELMRALLEHVDRHIAPHQRLLSLLEGKDDKPYAEREDLPLKGAIIARELTMGRFFEQLAELERRPEF